MWDLWRKHPLSLGHLNAGRGYSLIELLTALAVASVVAAIGVPRLSSYAQQYRLSGGANQIAVDVARARMKAIGENVHVRVRFGAQSFGSIGFGSTYQVSTSTDGVTFTSVGPPSSIAAGVNFYAFPQEVQFNRQGLASAPLTLWLYNQSYQWRVVTMNSIGRVTVQ
ncbi:hypothetical protein HRbin30_00025 [bacterium HR30]|nr:hypothetical protein HRbin30_00025 [bacterium HR30]